MPPQPCARSKPLPRALPRVWAETWGGNPIVTIPIPIPIPVPVPFPICAKNHGFEISMRFKGDQPLLLWLVKLTAQGQKEMDTQFLIFPYLILEIVFFFNICI